MTTSAENPAASVPDGPRLPQVDPGLSFDPRWLVAVLLLLGLGAGLVFPFPLEGRLWGEVFDFMHAPALFVTLIGIVGLLDPAAVGLSCCGSLIRMTTGRILIVAALLFVFGAGAEFLQAFAGRSPTLKDVFANSCGLMAGLIWLLGRRSWKTAATSLAVALLVIVSVTPAKGVLACWKQMQRFPRLDSFEVDLGSWTPANSRLKRTTDWATDGDHSLVVQLNSNRYSGVAMTWFESDWANHRELHFDIRSTADFDVTLKVVDQIHVTAGFPNGDRFERTISLKKAVPQHVVILLDEVSQAPQGRQLDLRDVCGIQWFTIRPPEGAMLLLDDVRLK